MFYVTSSAKRLVAKASGEGRCNSLISSSVIQHPCHGPSATASYIKTQRSKKYIDQNAFFSCSSHSSVHCLMSLSNLQLA